MYIDHFNLTEKPFSTKDIASFYYAAPQQAAMDMLLYGIEENEGFTVITGPPGVGKTTLLRRAQQQLRDETRVVLLSELASTGGPIIAQFSTAIGLETQDTAALTSFLEGESAHGERVVLMVDEAQVLNHNQLAELRLLTNMQREGLRFVDIVLSGQDDLLRILDQPVNEALSQRVAMKLRLETFSLEQTLDYVRFRVSIAGGQSNLFTTHAMEAVSHASRGVPRLINRIAERALIVAFVQNRQQVNKAAVEDAHAELDLDNEGDDIDMSASALGIDAYELLNMRLDRLERSTDRILQMLQETNSLARGLDPT